MCDLLFARRVDPSIDLLTAGAAWAQATAQLSGTVRDESGAVLPGVTVTVANDTGLVRTAVTDENGGYLLTNLPIGPYQLEVSLQGFRPTGRRASCCRSVRRRRSMRCSAVGRWRSRSPSRPRRRLLTSAARASARS